MRIAILGAGMSGLLAAKALKDNGFDNFVIYDKKIPESSIPVGLHYLHDPCGLPLEPHIVHNIVIPDNSYKPLHIQYSEKTGVPENNSVRDLPATVRVYDFSRAYKMLVEWLKPHIEEKEIRENTYKQLRKDFNYVISTIPLNIIAPQAVCEQIKLPVKYGKPNDGSDLFPQLNNVVIYNLNHKHDWYRYSRVNGIEMTEYIAGVRGVDGKITKIISDGSTSVYDLKNTKLVGRYGKWQRGYLAHEAYYETKAFVKEVI